jgi:hypothetical protein
MNRKRVAELQESFARRGRRFGFEPDLPAEVFTQVLGELIACPDCRSAVLEACGDKTSDIDATLSDLMMHDH